MDNKFIFAAGVLSAFVFLMHLIGGQLTLVDPLLDSNLIDQEKVEWLGAWHLITLLLVGFAFVLIKNGLRFKPQDKTLIVFIMQMCVLFSFSFILASLFLKMHAPQSIFFLPIALLINLGLSRC